MHDVAVNKISLTNPNIDINKWYKGFKEDYFETFNIINDYKSNNLKNLIIKDINSNKKYDFPILCEIKLVLEQTGFDEETLNLLNEIINNMDSKTEFEQIYDVYKNVHRGLK
jgi:DNA-binding transcriptional regulator GbsR (MarR family)